MSDIPVGDESLRMALIQAVKLLRAQNVEIGKIRASLMAHRRAIAAGHSDPIAVENQLRQFEDDAQGLALETQGFPEAAALIALLEAGKSPDTFDA